MTQQGIDVLDQGDSLVSLLTETLRAARDRGAELAAEARAKIRALTHNARKPGFP